MVTLRQLRYFEALSRHLHFGRAAEECAVSQPALSQQIQDLEADLGAGLIERSRSGVRLTPTGREVAARAQAVLRSVEDLAAFARHSGRTLDGRLRLGVIPSIAPYLLPRILPSLQTRYPGLDLEIRESQTRGLLDDLGEGRLDVVLIALPSGRGDFEELTLFDDPFVLATRADRAAPGSASIGDVIAGERLLLLEEGHCLRDQALALCGASNPDLRTQLGATSLTTILQMVAGGYGVTLLPAMSVELETRNNPHVAVRRFAAPEPHRRIGLAWRRSSPRAADFRALGALVGAVAADPPRGSPGAALEAGRG
jgi:LysR family hydrogen peroxide-inducible transcriptional activator